MLITRDQFLACNKRVTVPVPIGEGREILIRKPFQHEWDEFDFDAPHFRARLLIAFAVNGDGTPMFQPADLNKIVATWSDQVEAVAAAIMDAAGATRRAMEALAKNWQTTPKSSSGSGSPGTSASPATS